MRAVAKAIEQLEKQRVLVPDSLRQTKMDLVAKIGQQNQFDQQLRVLGEGLAEVMEMIEVATGKAHSERKPQKEAPPRQRHSRNSNQPVTAEVLQFPGAAGIRLPVPVRRRVRQRHPGHSRLQQQDRPGFASRDRPTGALASHQPQSGPGGGLRQVHGRCVLQELRLTGARKVNPSSERIVNNPVPRAGLFTIMPIRSSV